MDTNQTELSDDDDEATNRSSSGRNGAWEERQNKRLRTGNYSHLLSTRTQTVDQQDTRRFSPSSKDTKHVRIVSSDRFFLIASTPTKPKRYPANALTPINETRFASPGRDAFLSSIDRRPNPSYDPSQSPLFSTKSQVGHRVCLTPSPTNIFLLEKT